MPTEPLINWEAIDGTDGLREIAESPGPESGPHHGWLLRAKLIEFYGGSRLVGDQFELDLSTTCYRPTRAGLVVLELRGKIPFRGEGGGS